MSSWEYKVITSGKGGFATPALLEKFLNDLGRDEWEIVEFRSAPDNALAFTGLVRRSTQRDWTLEDAAAAAAKVEAEKLRAEFAAKFQAATSAAPAAEEKPASFLEEKTAPDDGFRKPIDTSRDSEPEAAEEEPAEKDEWDELASEAELPTFFDALKPHMRRNQRGPGMSVGTDYLAKKWGLAEEDIKGALVECGLQIPADENAKPVYVEYDGDLYWVNINRRGEVWINTREKPRPVFRVVQATKFVPEQTEEAKPAAEAPAPAVSATSEGGQPTHGERAAAAAAAPSIVAKSPVPLPEGIELLAKIKPLMRRSRRGPGGSGSVGFLARALKCSDADLTTAFAALGLALAPTPEAKPVEIEVGGELWWLNQDSRGGVWINGRTKREPEGQPGAAQAPASEGVAPAATAEATPVADVPAPVAAAPAEPPVSEDAAPASEAAPAETPTPATDGGALTGVRLLLKGTRTGAFAGKVDRLASELGKTPEEVVAALVAAGLKVPEKSREKPLFVEHAGEIYWFNLNAKGELWLNAKASKFADDSEAAESEGGRRPRRGRGRGAKTTPEVDAPAAESAPVEPAPSAPAAPAPEVT